MNIFLLDENPELAAKYHCDKHVVKMILEGAQILCTVLHLCGQSAPYKKTHVKHPCCLWAMESLSNWLWLKDFVLALNDEKIYRYGTPHKSAMVAMELETPNIPDKGLTPFAQAMPDKYRNCNPIRAYRKYYLCNKKHITTWKNRPIPYFMKG